MGSLIGSWGNTGKNKAVVTGHPVASLRDEMDALFEDFFNGWSVRPVTAIRKNAESFMPKISVTETDKEFKVTAELPGMTEKDIDVQVNPDYLTIRGEKRSESEKTEGGKYYSECSYGSFERSIPLGDQIDHDKVDAKYKNGVLQIILPKVITPENKPRKISVRPE